MCKSEDVTHEVGAAAHHDRAVQAQAGSNKPALEYRQHFIESHYLLAY